MSTGPSRRSYRPGGWFGIFGDHASVLLPPSEKARVAALWELVDDGAGFDEVLDGLLASGLRDLPGFVLVSSTDHGTKVVLRGPAVAAFVADGAMVELTGSSETTWVERTLHEVSQLFIQVEPTEDDGDEDLVIGSGLVRVARVEEPPFRPDDLVAALPTAAPVAEPAEEAPEEPEPPVDLAVPAGEGPLDPEVTADPILPVGLAASDEPTADQPALEPTGPSPEGGPDEPAYDEPALEEPQLEEHQPEEPQPEEPQPEEHQPEEPAPADHDPAAPTEVLPTTPPWQPPAPPGPPPTTPMPEAPGSPFAPPPAAGWPPPVSPQDAPTRAEEWSPQEFARPEPGIPGQPPAPPVTRPVARLLFSSGDVVDVDRAILVGRAPEARRFATHDQPRLVPVPSPHQEISSTHLEVRPGSGADHGTAVVTDLGSTNGTVLVQPGLPPEDLRPGIAVQLLPGAIIDLGDGVTIQVTNV